MTHDPALRERLQHHLDELPVLPMVLVQLLALDPDDEHLPERVVSLIESEPNLSTRVLAAANSAASSPVAHITTLPNAIARIGTTGASNLVLTIGVTRVFVPRDDWEWSLWRHALQVALAARALAAHARPAVVRPDEAYAAGLLHDIGRFVMFQEAPDQLREIDEGAWDSPEQLVSLEREICGVDHAELGALACHVWGLPDEIVDVVRHHHDRAGSQGPVAPLANVVRTADLAMFRFAMTHEGGYADADIETVARDLTPKLPAFVHLTPTELHDLIRSVNAEADEIAKVLGIH